MILLILIINSKIFHKKKLLKQYKLLNYNSSFIIHTIVFDKFNNFNYQFKIQNGYHIIKKKINWFKKPKLIIFNNKKIAIFLISAKIGKLNKNNELYFYENIKIINFKRKLNITYIKTQNLYFNFITQNIEAKGLINIYGNKFHIIGKNMKGNLRNKEIELLNNINFFYEK